MDIDTLKSVLPAVGGTLALAGGVFTFVAGRLKDAESPDAKANVVRLALEWTSIILNVVGLALGSFTRAYFAAVAFFLIAYGLQTFIFLRRRGSPSRTEVVSFSLLTAVVVSGVVVALLFSVTHDVLDLIQGLIDVQKARPK